jgi:hypothetical protein
MLALSSCTLLFDPGNLDQGGDGGPPGSIDGGIRPDAIPPGQFGLALLDPATVQEGAGAAWPVPIIVRGQNIAPGATVELIESLNSVIRKATKRRKLFPTDDSALKVAFLAIQQASKKWTMPIRNWKPALNRFIIEFGDRLDGHL